MEVVCYLNTETWILCLMDSRTIFLFTEKCLLSKDIKDYSFVSQGKVSSHSVEIAKIFTHYIFSTILCNQPILFGTKIHCFNLFSQKILVRVNFIVSTLCCSSTFFALLFINLVGNNISLKWFLTLQKI